MICQESWPVQLIPNQWGVGQYRLFLEYIGESNNNQAGKIKTLQNAFDELTTILKRCLDLHGRIVPESMRLSHQALVELFEKNFNDRIEAAYSSRDESDSSSFRVILLQGQFLVAF